MIYRDEGKIKKVFTLGLYLLLLLLVNVYSISLLLPSAAIFSVGGFLSYMSSVLAFWHFADPYHTVAYPTSEG